MSNRKGLDEKTLIDISGCNKECYCLLRELIKHTSLDGFMLEQLRCVDDFKWEIGERIGNQIGWELMDEDRRREVALGLWVDVGYAKKFRNIYNDGVGHRKLYDSVVNGSLHDSELVASFSKIIEKEKVKPIPA